MVPKFTKIKSGMTVYTLKGLVEDLEGYSITIIGEIQEDDPVYMKALGGGKIEILKIPSNW